MADDIPRLPTLPTGHGPTEQHIRVFEAYRRELGIDYADLPLSTVAVNMAADWWNAGAPTLRTPDAWCTEYGLEIADPDGWRTKDAPPWDQPIGLSEFARRYWQCTARGLGSEQQARFDADVKAAGDA